MNLMNMKPETQKQLRNAGIFFIFLGLGSSLVFWLLYASTDDIFYVMLATFSVLPLFTGIALLMYSRMPEMMKKRMEAARPMIESFLKDNPETANQLSNLIKSQSQPQTENQTRKYCKHCGAQIEPDATFCVVCGRKIN